jgi:hypothetical protein
VCRLSYPDSLSWNEILDGGAGAVAAAAGTMPCLETLEWVLVHFPFSTSQHSLPFLICTPLSKEWDRQTQWIPVERVERFLRTKYCHHFRLAILEGMAFLRIP